MPQKADRMRRGYNPLNTQYIAFGCDHRNAWVEPLKNLTDGYEICRRMLQAGAHVSLIIDIWKPAIVHDATKPDAQLSLLRDLEPTTAPSH